MIWQLQESMLSCLAQWRQVRCSRVTSHTVISLGNRANVVLTSGSKENSCTSGRWGRIGWQLPMSLAIGCCFVLLHWCTNEELFPRRQWRVALWTVCWSWRVRMIKRVELRMLHESSVNGRLLHATLLSNSAFYAEWKTTFSLVHHNMIDMQCSFWCVPRDVARSYNLVISKCTA